MGIHFEHKNDNTLHQSAEMITEKHDREHELIIKFKFIMMFMTNCKELYDRKMHEDMQSSILPYFKPATGDNEF